MQEYVTSRKSHKLCHAMLFYCYYDSLRGKYHEKKNTTLSDPTVQSVLLQTKTQSNNYTQS